MRFWEAALQPNVLGKVWFGFRGRGESTTEWRASRTLLGHFTLMKRDKTRPCCFCRVISQTNYQRAARNRGEATEQNAIIHAALLTLQSFGYFQALSTTLL